MTDPCSAATYRQQRAADDQLYQRGYAGDSGQPQADVSRTLRRSAIAAPLLLPGLPTTAPGVAMSLMLTSGAYDVLNRLRHQCGWLERGQTL